MKPPLSYVPLLPLLIAFCGGIVLSRYCAGSELLIVGAALCVAVALFILKWRYAGVLALVVGVGCAVECVDGSMNRCNVGAEGRIVGAKSVVLSVSETEQARKLIVRLDAPYRGNCYLTVPYFTPEVACGDYVAFDGELKSLNQSLDIDGDIDLSGFYYRNHVSARAVADRGSLEVLDDDAGLVRRIRRLGPEMVDRLVQNGMSAETQSFVAALLLGDDSMLDSGVRPEFSASGLAHLLALSGLHVAIIAGIVSFLLLPLVWCGLGKTRWFIVILFLWFYAVLTGLSPSVTRAVIMFTLVILAKLLGRGYSSGNALCFAALAILVFSPRSLFAPGFQLSFLAVAALVTIPPLVLPRTKQNPVKRLVIDYIVFTLSAVAGTSVLAMYYFHSQPLYFLLANIPCALLLPFIIGGALLAMILLLAGVDWLLLDHAMDAMCSCLNWVAETVSHLPGAVVTGIFMPVWGVFIAYAAIACVVAWIYFRNRRWGVSAAVLALVAVHSAVLERDRGDILFIGRNSAATNVVCVANGSAQVVSTVNSFQLEQEKENIEIRYADFLVRNGIDSVSMIGASAGGGSTLVTFACKTILVVNDNVGPSNGTVADYLVVGHGFKGDIVELANSLRCDTVLLGTDINAVRCRRYNAELINAGIPVRSLSGGYGLVIRN